VVFAGPLFNFLFAVLAYWLMFVMGVTGLRSTVDQVTPGSPAYAAGLRAGQEIVAVDGRETRTWEAVIQGIMGAALRQDAVAVEARDQERGRRAMELDLSGIVLDDLTRGQFFDTVGLQPRRPLIPPVIGFVEPGGPAERSGLADGDRIVSADGEAIADWRSWVTYVRSHPEQVVSLKVDREGVLIELSLRPERVEGDDGPMGRIGAGVRQPEAALDQFYVTERYGPAAAFTHGLRKTWEVSALTLRMFWKILTLQVSVENLSGPISIAQYAGHSAQIGVSRFLEFLGIVSISLGILNLLPIPLLDGGHLMYYLIELLKGRPVSEEAQLMGQRLGIAMLVGLMSLAFYNDLARLFG